MKKSNELDVRGTLVRVIKIGGEDILCDAFANERSRRS